MLVTEDTEAIKKNCEQLKRLATDARVMNVTCS
jgi:hypothetical protein